jgi:lysine/ornithine N-monooxygenase
MDKFTNEEMQMAICMRCGEFFPDARKQLGFDKCMPCNTIYAKARGDQIKQQSAPMNKSNYMYISSAEFVKQLNPKRTT